MLLYITTFYGHFMIFFHYFNFFSNLEMLNHIINKTIQIVMRCLYSAHIMYVYLKFVGY